MFEHSRVLRCLELGFQHVNFGEHSSAHNSVCLFFKVPYVTSECNHSWSPGRHRAVLEKWHRTADKDMALSGVELPAFKSWLYTLLAVQPGQVASSLCAHNSWEIRSLSTRHIS